MPIGTCWERASGTDCPRLLSGPATGQANPAHVPCIGTLWPLGATSAALTARAWCGRERACLVALSRQPAVPAAVAEGGVVLAALGGQVAGADIPGAREAARTAAHVVQPGHPGICLAGNCTTRPTRPRSERSALTVGQKGTAYTFLLEIACMTIEPYEVCQPDPFHAISAVFWFGSLPNAHGSWHCTMHVMGELKLQHWTNNKKQAVKPHKQDKPCTSHVAAARCSHCRCRQCPSGSPAG